VTRGISLCRKAKDLSEHNVKTETQFEGFELAFHFLSMGKFVGSVEVDNLKVGIEVLLIQSLPLYINHPFMGCDYVLAIYVKAYIGFSSSNRPNKKGMETVIGQVAYSGL